MSYDVLLDKHVIGTLGTDNKIDYNKVVLNAAVKEMIAGSSGGKFQTTAKVVYRWDKNRKTNNDAVWNLWKTNPVVQSRIVQLNALVFGRGFKWMYEDESTQNVVDRFWRVNKLRSKLGSLSTDSQLYGEIFIGLYPQPTGDVLMRIYESNQVDIDFNAGDVNDINKYIITYKDEETQKDEQFEMMPVTKYLNNIEFTNAINMAKTSKVRKSLGLNGAAGIKGKGLMAHIKFNNASSEIHGTSDFKQVFDIISDYLNFVGDRLTIHQLYGSPIYDVTIDSDNPEDIIKRIDELAGFTIGSNPVHNKREEWKPLEFTHGGIPANGDEKILRGLICAGLSFPEYLLFNQSEPNGGDNSFALTKLAEDRQDEFGQLFTDIHKAVVAIAGGDITLVDEGQIIFPEINTMSEKMKAETYVLKVGAKICSRRTAAHSMGHNWELELKQILEEEAEIGALLEGNNGAAGQVGGRFTSRINNQDPDRDTGDEDGPEGKVTTPLTQSKNRGNTSGGAV